jgi:hypothetical protein
MTGRRKWAGLSVLLGAVIAGTFCYHYFWVEWSPVVAKPMSLWPDREQAAGRGRSKPVGSVAKGEVVDVLWDRYGKDYWACYVRTRNGTKGWLLCTDL